MAQHLFAAETAPSLTDLDANFTEVYDRTASIIGSGGNVFVGTGSATFSATRLEVVAAAANNAFGAKVAGAAYAPLMAWNADTSGNNLFEYFYTEASLTLRGSITYNRGGGLVAYNTTSDRRAKDILGAVPDPGAAIDAMQVYLGRMKGATIARPMLIADELQAVAPYAVTGDAGAVDADGAPLLQQMDASSLVPLLIAELQALRARVAALEGG